LFTDFGGEICSNEFDHFLLANDVQHIVVPKGEHYANRPAEKGIGDIDRMTKAIMGDKNIPSQFWDIVAEHCVVLNAVTSPSGCASLSWCSIAQGAFAHQHSLDAQICE
jgi:hypothetical protein